MLPQRERLILRAIVTPPDATTSSASRTTGNKVELSLLQIGPGRYEGWFDTPQTGMYLIRVAQIFVTPRQPEKSTSLALSVSYPSEYATVQANPRRMAQLAQAGGVRTDVPPAQVFDGKRPPTTATEDAAPILLCAALCLFLLDLAARCLQPFSK